MDERTVKFTLQSLRRIARTAPRHCYVPDCKDSAIWSHILQKNGLLNKLARNGKLIELREDDLFLARAANKSKHGYYFTERNIASAFTFLGFCSDHDRDIFSEIETQDPDIYNPRTHLLFSYRAFLNELQKQENNVAWYSKIFADSKLVANLSSKEMAKYRNNEKAMKVKYHLGNLE